MIEHEPDIDGIIQRLDAICHSWFGGMPTQFAKALDISYENLRQYLTGRSLPGNKMQARLRHIGIDPEWVIYGTGHLPDRLKPDMVKALATPQVLREKQFRVRTSVPSGAAEFGEPSDIYQPWVIEDYTSADHLLLEISESMSDGMRPVINPGDRVLIARRSDIKDGDLVAARWANDDGAIRIYRRLDEKVQLWTLNPAIAPVSLSPKAFQLYKVLLIRKA
ncbi:MAG: S24 family peptidase [Ignavibacteria bacterium]|nr:S24 family peptidase [Ignavibacteria bacterium]